MFCPTCGSSVPDGATFCPDCGNPITPSNSAPQQQFPQQPPAPVQSAPFVPTGAQTPKALRDQTIAAAEQQGLGMKWYKFLIYFALIAGGVVDLIMGLLYLTGIIYAIQGASASMVYHFYPALMPMNVLFGLATLALGALRIFDRILMARFSAKAPKLLYIVLGASIGISAIYQIVSSLILANRGVLVTALFSAVLSGVVLFLNIRYFGRRSHLFTNA